MGNDQDQHMMAQEKLRVFVLVVTFTILKRVGFRLHHDLEPAFRDRISPVPLVIEPPWKRSISLRKNKRL